MTCNYNSEQERSTKTKIASNSRILFQFVPLHSILPGDNIKRKWREHMFYRLRIICRAGKSKKIKPVFTVVEIDTDTPADFFSVYLIFISAKYHA